MTDAPRPLDEALNDHDVTLSLTPGQLVLVVIGFFVLLRVIRSLRGS